MIRFIVILLSVSFLVACTSKKNDAPITIAVSTTPLSAPFYVAKDKGYFDEFCGEVNIVDIAGGRKSFMQMIEQKADFATSSESVMAFQSFERQDFVAISTFVESVNDIKIVANKSADIRSPVDLINKKVGYIQGSASEYFLSVLLALHNMQMEQIKLVAMSADETSDALIEGRVDAISAWEPFAYNAQNTLGDDANILNTKHLYSLTFNLISRREFVESNPDRAQCVLEGLKLAIEDINSEPEYAKALIKRKLKLDDNFIQWIWPDYLFRLSLKRTLVMSMESQAEWLSNKKDFHERPQTSSAYLISPEILRNVDADAVRL